VKGAGDIVVVIHDASAFSEFSKKRLLRLILHEQQSA
jgi:hypothetical protein